MSIMKTTAAVIAFTPLTASILWFAIGFAPSSSCAAPAEPTAQMAPAPENIVVMDKPDIRELVKLMPAYVRGPLSSAAPAAATNIPVPKPRPQRHERTLEEQIALAEAGL